MGAAQDAQQRGPGRAVGYSYALGRVHRLGATLMALTTVGRLAAIIGSGPGVWERARDGC
jgi:hypothetical protein